MESECPNFIELFNTVIGFIFNELKRLLTLNYVIPSYETRSSEVLHISEGIIARSGINTFFFDVSKLLSKLYLELLNKDTTKSKIKALSKQIS